MSNLKRIALKVDCDTFEGTKAGIPTLLKILERKKIRASFFFTLGPDRSGCAIRRVFTQKGFLKKMIRSKAVSLYGPKTMLYGTLLPAPQIGKNLKDTIRSVYAAGHDVGVHGWDHVQWHDYLDQMTEQEIRLDYKRAHETFQDIFGFSAHSSAAPGWHVTPSYLLVQESFQLLYSSNTRRGSPYFPSVAGATLQVLDIPTTLPTWDEALADPRFTDRADLVEMYRQAIQGTEVHTLHTEVEGMSFSSLFEKQLDSWLSDGIGFLTLADYAKENLVQKKSIPMREPTRIELPFRGGKVSSSSPLKNVMEKAALS